MPVVVAVSENPNTELSNGGYISFLLCYNPCWRNANMHASQPGHKFQTTPRALC